MAEPAPERRGPGRPSTGARERILEAGLEVLKSDGYAGLTTSKVAARAGGNKALIAYHFGSKQGLVAAVAEAVSAAITSELLAVIGEPPDIAGLATRLVDGLDGLVERDPGLARLYFDLASYAVVDENVSSIMNQMKQAFRDVLGDLLTEMPGGPRRRDAEPAAVYLIACLEGLMLEQLERGRTASLKRARDLLVRSCEAVITGR